MSAEDLAIIQEILDSEPVVTALGAPINVQSVAAAVKELRTLAPGTDSAAVANAWTKLSGVLGSRLTAALLSGPEWRSFCPISRPLDDYDADDHAQTVWLSQDQNVVADAVMAGDGTFLGLKFTARPR